MWKGMFAPIPPRDYQHSSFVDHLKQNGIEPEINPESVLVHTDPITEEPLDSPEKYYKVTITLGNKDYVYLVQSSTEGKMPSKKDIDKALTQYLKHPTVIPRKIEDYLV